jgi:membrane protein YdbS with pleckstrin-like domain
LFRIQNVEIQEGIIMRKYNLANVNLSTAGGNTEVILISKQEANIIKQFIRDNKQETL